MKEFFTETGGIGFNIFGILHISITIVTIIGAIMLFVFRDKLKRFKNKKNIRYIMAAVLFINMAVYYISLILRNDYTWKTDLPLHFCFITGYLFMFILITGNKKLYKIIYFFTFVGPIPAILLPDLTQTYDRFIFWQFIISHHVMLLTSMYVLVVLEYKVEKSDIFKAFIAGNILAATMAIFNSICGTNYIMMGELPEHIYRIFPFTAYLPPIIWLELAGLIAVSIAYIPVYILNRISGKFDELEATDVTLLDDEINCAH
ncbi:MAG: TIGR02206 family membrane protein [Clostridia bacterium]